MRRRRARMVAVLQIKRASDEDDDDGIVVIIIIIARCGRRRRQGHAIHPTPHSLLCIKNQSRSPARSWQFCALPWRWAAGRLTAAFPRKLARQLQTERLDCCRPPTHHHRHHHPSTTHQTSHGKIACKTDRPGERMLQAFCVNSLLHSTPQPASLAPPACLCTISIQPVCAQHALCNAMLRPATCNAVVTFFLRDFLST